MTPSLSIALPSIHRITKRETKVIIKQQPSQPQPQCQFSNKSRNHVRTTSVPSVLPSFKIQKDASKLSMDILLDAIDLDQQMRQFFRTEVVKSKTRVNSFNPSQVMMARRRSKSAPGAPPSYHHQRAFSARWTTPSQTVTSDSQAQEVAKLIVQQHFDAVKKR